MRLGGGLLLLLACLTLHLSADAAWTAWVYEAASGQLLRFNERGAVLETQTLPAELDTLVISPQGERLAYLAAQNLHVLSLRNRRELATFALPPPISGAPNDDDIIQLDPRAFRLDGAKLAFSYRIAGEGWSLVIMDAQTGEIAQRLAYGADEVASFLPLHAGVLPQVQAFYDDAVFFTIRNDARNPLPTHRSYRWSLNNDTLREVWAFPTFDNGAWLPSGETLNPIYDGRFAAENALIERDFMQRNALLVYAQSQQFPFYTDESLDFERVWFIEGGQRILAEAFFDPLNTWWVIAGRSGDRVRRQRAAGEDIMGTPDGFIYMTNLRGQSVVVHVNTQTLADQGQTVWVAEGAWRIVWADAGDANLMAWSRLAQPVENPPPPAPGVAPTPLPEPAPIRFVGMAAQIQTLEDDYLNLRDAPTLDSGVLALLESGVEIILLDGPRASAGFTWWRVRVGNRRGWIVEALPDVVTIIPRQVIVPPQDDDDEENNDAPDDNE